MSGRIIGLYLTNTTENKNLTAKGLMWFYTEETIHLYPHN